LVVGSIPTRPTTLKEYVMIYEWELFVDGNSQGFFSGITEYGVKQQYFMQYGSSSKYSGIGFDQIEAVRL